MALFRHCAALVTIALLLGGCAGNGDNKPAIVDRQIPAPKEPPAPPPVRNERLDPALQTAARAELDAALNSDEKFVRAHAIEAAQNTLGAAAKATYLAGLTDARDSVRFTSAMAIGRLQIADAKPQLLQMVNDPNATVGVAVRYALHRLGDSTYPKDLEATARDPDWRVRANTAMVLGLLNEQTAIRVLRPMQRDAEPAVHVQVAEALWRLGDTDGLKMLVASAQSRFTDDQMIAVLALAAPKDRRVLGHLRSSLTADYPEICLVAARAMGILGSDAGYAIAAEGAKSKDPRQRLLAAQALGAIGRTDAQGLLADLLKDRESTDVRLSAAQAILQLTGTASASYQ
jgi:HEAT repeat protein